MPFLLLEPSLVSNYKERTEAMTAQEFRATADAFTLAYVEAALWSTSAEIGECCRRGCNYTGVTTEYDTCAKCGYGVSGKDKSFNDRGFNIESIAPETLDKIATDCARFQAENEALITQDNLTFRQKANAEEQAGHDFWLTRNGHGCGFWDGDWEEPAATMLTTAAKSFGEVNLYLGDDGLIYA